MERSPRFGVMVKTQDWWQEGWSEEWGYEGGNQEQETTQQQQQPFMTFFLWAIQVFRLVCFWMMIQVKRQLKRETKRIVERCLACQFRC